MLTATKMVRSLMEQGLTQNQIANFVGTNQQRISAINQGGDCNYMLGKSLENLYKSIVINKMKLDEVTI